MPSSVTAINLRTHRQTKHQSTAFIDSILSGAIHTATVSRTVAAGAGMKLPDDFHRRLSAGFVKELIS